MSRQSAAAPSKSNFTTAIKTEDESAIFHLGMSARSNFCQAGNQAFAILIFGQFRDAPSACKHNARLRSVYMPLSLDVLDSLASFGLSMCYMVLCNRC